LSRNIHGYPILEVRTERDPVIAASLLATINDPGTYDVSGALCFQPGLGLRLYSWSGGTVDVLVCLDCRYLWPTHAPLSARRAISGVGVAKFTSFYNASFPSHRLPPE